MLLLDWQEVARVIASVLDFTPEQKRDLFSDDEDEDEDEDEDDEKDDSTDGQGRDGSSGSSTAGGGGNKTLFPNQGDAGQRILGALSSLQSRVQTAGQPLLANITSSLGFLRSEQQQQQQQQQQQGDSASETP